MCRTVPQALENVIIAENLMTHQQQFDVWAVQVGWTVNIATSHFSQ